MEALVVALVLDLDFFFQTGRINRTSLPFIKFVIFEPN
jgi:hypothetical protein